MRSYGELFKEGDTIGVYLDLDHHGGTLSFSRNDRSLGVAVEGLVTHLSAAGLHESPPKLCPAFSMYNNEDQLSLIPNLARSSLESEASTRGYGGSADLREGTAVAFGAVESLTCLLDSMKSVALAQTDASAVSLSNCCSLVISFV